MLCLHLSGFKSPNLIDDGLLHIAVTSERVEFWMFFFVFFPNSLFVSFPLLVGNQVCRWAGQELQSSGLCEMGQRDRYLADMMDDFNPSD